MKFARPRGTRDILPDQIKKYQQIEKISREVFSRFCYKEIRTPTFEEKELFCRSIGAATDIVEKEMYVFTDRKGRELVLRPEGTAGVVRAFLENDIDKKENVTKVYYYGPMFRYERPQSGRYREFYQIGAEFFGDANPGADAEMIRLAVSILDRFDHLGKTEIIINSLGCAGCRQQYKTELISSIKLNITGYCHDCQSRFEKNPLRILDCKIDKDKISGLPLITNHLCPDCQRHFEKLQAYLTGVNCSYRIDPYLVRGLDDYTRTIFEIKLVNEEASENTIIAGGRYDNLVEELGGKPTPACGFAIGVDRICSFMDNEPVKTDSEQEILVSVITNKDADQRDNRHIENYAFNTADNLRKTGFNVLGPFFERSIKAQLRLADSLKVKCTLIIGENELKTKTVVIKNMANQTQESVDGIRLIEYLKQTLT
jgi:histidyl-tRNA synthetase